MAKSFYADLQGNGFKLLGFNQYPVVQAETSGTINASENQLIPVNTQTVTSTVNPPVSPTDGETVFGVIDSRANASTNNITIDFVTSGQNYYGTSQNLILNTDQEYAQLVYIDSGVGWVRI